MRLGPGGRGLSLVQVKWQFQDRGELDGGMVTSPGPAAGPSGKASRRRGQLRRLLSPPNVKRQTSGVGVSDVSKGPGWWFASDGRWYPPELAASAVRPPPTDAEGLGAGAPGMYSTPPSPIFATRATNALAVASLVLGIVWLYWIGSILALVFGYVALIQIRERNESGHGLAVAGIVLGWVGVGIGILTLTIALITAGAGSGS